MQAQFYDDVVCSRTSGHRFWAVRDAADEMVGMAGLTDVSPENGHAEISLVVDPDKHGQGIGGAAVELILTEAFRAMRLLTVYGEVYSHNPAVGFWFRQLERWPGTGHTQLPRRKFWNGRLHDSIYFWLTADGFHPRTEHVHRFDTAEIRGVQ
jgi:RimJ/RimL family protein N-acetyltransferase